MDNEDLRLAVYRAFAETGRAPQAAGLADQLGTGLPAVTGGLAELARARHLALDRQGHIVMAHPFSAVPLGFSVMGARTLWWGGCAWDSFALPHLLPGENEVLVATRCPACGSPHAWNAGTAGPPAGGQVAHFLVPAARMWDDVVHTCGHQRLFCSGDCVTAWLRETGLPRGYEMRPAPNPGSGRPMLLSARPQRVTRVCRTRRGGAPTSRAALPRSGRPACGRGSRSSPS